MIFRISLAAILLSATPLLAQSSPQLSGCAPSPEVRKAIADQLDDKKFNKLTYSEQVAHTHEVLEKLIAAYPRDISLQRRLMSATRNGGDTLHPGVWAAMQEDYRQRAKANPNDPVILDLAGYALIGTDTPEAIRLLEAAKAQAPQFVWPYLDLTTIYASGKFKDKQKATENLTVFWTACPATTDYGARWQLSKDTALEAKVAPALRAQLEKETDPKQLKEYEYLWGLEFRVHPPQEHDALRKQVAEDVKRLETVNPKSDAEWQALILKGYKTSGAAQPVLTAKEDELLKQYPHSDKAYDILQERWNDAHKKPDDAKDTAAWAAWRKANREATLQWIADFPDNDYLQRYARFFLDYGDDSITEQEGIAAMDNYLEHAAQYGPPDLWFVPDQAAGFLLQHKWQPDRALALMQQTQQSWEKSQARQAKRDNQTEDEIKDEKKQNADQERDIRSDLLHAALLAHKPEAVQSMRAALEAPPPQDDKTEAQKQESGYWTDRARLALLDDHKQDALTYYQKALQTRLEAPQYYQGKLTDDLGDEARGLWKETGGTETAWTVWSSQPAANAASAAEARWEKPKMELPTFELADMTGKTWRTKDLNGKTVLINLWATWCGPCNAELPQLQKLYDQAKNRSDLQILTFDIDEDVGLVAPYLKKKGYTFPVLPAYGFVVNLLDGYAIPQSWLVDTKGKWQWREIGYGGEDDWVQQMTQKLDAMKTGS
jgi:thiol-disulfide isomerase/thioredoxin